MIQSLKLLLPINYAYRLNWINYHQLKLKGFLHSFFCQFIFILGISSCLKTQALYMRALFYLFKKRVKAPNLVPLISLVFLFCCQVLSRIVRYEWKILWHLFPFVQIDSNQRELPSLSMYKAGIYYDINFGLLAYVNRANDLKMAVLCFLVYARVINLLSWCCGFKWLDEEIRLHNGC